MDVCVTYWIIYFVLLVSGKIYKIRMLVVIVYVYTGT